MNLFLLMLFICPCLNCNFSVDSSTAKGVDSSTQKKKNKNEINCTFERCVFDFIMHPSSEKQQQQQQASNVVENYSNACVLCCAFAL